MLDLHRHDEFSTFDGYGKATKLAKVAKANGLSALGVSNHGTMDGLTDHYFACIAEGIKPILGCEVYFQPKFDKDKPKYHLCLFAMNLKGYSNLCKIVTEANERFFYYKPTVTMDLLKAYSEGIICTTACVGSLFSQYIIKDKNESAMLLLERFKDIYGENFYIEIQPYKLAKPGIQEKVNIQLLKFAKELNIKPILTSDSHYIIDEQETYYKLWEMGGHNVQEVKATYSERFMPECDEMADRFMQMHGEDFSNANKICKAMYRNMQEIIDKVDGDYLSKLPLTLPKFSPDEDSVKLLQKEIIKGLKAKKKYKPDYIERCKREFNIIKMHDFVDYFLIVQDYVRWAKDNGIAVGPGRGSVCNSAVAYALDITNVDPLYFNLDFDRFLREDKKKLPDIDLDFETDRRHEVIDYILNKYPGKTVQICSYGLYRIDNLINDLCKVCGVDDKEVNIALKKFIASLTEDKITIDMEKLRNSKEHKYYNKLYDNILEHFINLFRHVRFIGTHAAGVALVGGDITDYTPLQRRGQIYSSAYDLSNLESINVVKFDILGLKTMSGIQELEKLTDDRFDYSWLEDQELFDRFKVGDTLGIFQCESKTFRNILEEIDADNMDAVIAGNALNRPGPLQLGMPRMYADNKRNIDLVKDSKYYKYTKDTYGTIIYQEQIIAICRNIGNMEYAQIDKILKMLKGGSTKDKDIQERHKVTEEYKGIFYKGSKRFGFTRKESDELFDKFLVYSFNKGHSTGYAIIGVQEMYYKVYYPLQFWYVKMKYAGYEADLALYKAQAVKDGSVVMLPHVNYSADYSIRKVDGQEAIQEGMSSIKNVGAKAAKYIEKERKKNGPFYNYDDFTDRVKVKGSPVNKRVIDALKEAGALEFNKKTYESRVIKYNSTLYMKGMQKNG